MSTSESPVPKFRGRHRSNKSSHITNPATPSKPQFNNNNVQYAQRASKEAVTPPQSPRAYQQSPTNVSGKKKRKSKPRPREVNTDIQNAVYQQGYDSPTMSSSNDESNGGPASPTRGVLTTPTKAYAGPNFHSSPAPSSLPVPSWFSKSVPATPSAATSLQAMLEINDEKISSLSQSLEEPESHLEKLFRADKEEKARNGHRASGMVPRPALVTLANGSPESPINTRRQSPDATELTFPDLFPMDTDRKLPTSPSREIPAQNLFRPAAKPLKMQSEGEARSQSDALRSFLRQPSSLPLVSEKRPVERPVRQAPPPSTPAKRRPSLPHPNHSAPRAQFQTPVKKASQQKTFNSERQPHFVLTPPKGPRSQASKQTSPSHREYSPRAASYGVRKDITTDSVIPVTEMEEYLRRVLNLNSRAIATPAVAS